MTSPSATPIDEKLAARIAASADNWKRRLLDLTKRNKALNFRPTRVSTVAIVDELPSEIFRQLYLREQKLRFKSQAESESTIKSPSKVDADDSSAQQEDIEYDIVATDFAPYDPAELHERHTDDWLQTALAPEALDKSLRRLDEQARLTIEEQGVNTLFLALGTLHYVESKDSAETYRAPLIMLPVELSRASARTGYVVRASDDEAIVNPALAEYLRSNYGISLPELPDSGEIPDNYDLQTFMTKVSELISARAGWSVKSDAYLALFNFQKFVMYKDLETNIGLLTSHRLVRQLVSRVSTGGQVVGLPSDVRQMDLDEHFPPETTAQVVDADSSQLRAIAATARGYDLVIEGPPGTGKSQTITNIIGSALAAGKSVLFVAEKMAALQVVYRRLVEAGLGEFCLELHSSKANKRAVMQELAVSLDASLNKLSTNTTSSQQLPGARQRLTTYVRAVHGPFGKLGVSPYRAYGEFERVAAAKRVPYEGSIDAFENLIALEATVRELRELAAASAGIGVPDEHPWRDSVRPFYTSDALDDVRMAATSLAELVASLTTSAGEVSTAFALPPIQRLRDVETAIAVAEVMHKSPGAPLAVLRSDAWNAPPPSALQLIERGRAVVALATRIRAKLKDDALLEEHASDIAYVERKSQGILSIFAFLDGRYRAIKKRWQSYRQPSYKASLAEQASDMKLVDRLRAERATLESSAADARALFGELWQGEKSDWVVLENYIRWVVEFRSVCVRHGLSDRALEVAALRAPSIEDVKKLRAQAEAVERQRLALCNLIEWPSDYLRDSTLTEIHSRATELADNAALGPRWAAFEVARSAVAKGAAAELLPAAMSGSIACPDLPEAFLRAFWSKWLTAVIRERPALQGFHTMSHEQRVEEFRQLDRSVLRENRQSLIGKLRDRVQQRLQTGPAAACIGDLRREMVRQRGIQPLRKTMQKAEPAIRAIKPCFMMSPLTVAQYLAGKESTFDVVVFDEASQLPAEDAVGAIIRGNQLVVVGDPKQLPPTNFFSVQSAVGGAPVDADGTPMYEDSESILEEYMGAGTPMSRLKWHYRSAHESLIHFSNVSFYDSVLYTFPSVDTATVRSGLQFEYVNGVYEGKGLNLIEARRVADEVVSFAREQLDRRARGETVQSLGVGTFNMRQQLAIQDELEQRRRENPDIEEFFNRGTSEPFFVKNLENIQGDERDVIFLSVTYAKAADGRLRYNFGPVNGENGWRRLNVLTTRARQRMKIFSSMRGDDISVTATNSNGARLLREFLSYAEHGRLESTTASLNADAESPFEQSVITELTRRGITVVPQVGVAGYRIDIGVIDDVAPGRFLCGIECDGVAYHSSETARDRDRLRQQVLEARGWTIHRVWSTDWFKDRPGQVDRLLALIEKSRVRAASERAAQQERQDRAASEAAEREVKLAEVRSGAPSATVAPTDNPYVRPVAIPYTMSGGEGQYAGRDILQVPLGELARAVEAVVNTESPVHVDEVVARVVARWSTRAGSRIEARILDAVRAAERDSIIRRRGDFLWSRSDNVVVRSRAGIRMAAERIAPEELEAAIAAVLAGGHGFSRPQLTGEVRALLGFGRTGAALEEAIGGAIDRLLASAKVGEGSTGIRLRVGDTTEEPSQGSGASSHLFTP